MTIAFPTEETTATTQNPACKCGARRGTCTCDASPETPLRKPLSQKKLNANRVNALKSTGPRTQKGKAKVSQNARTHGLSSAQAPDFTNDSFHQAYEELKEEHRPITPTQTTLVREIAHIMWKLDQIPKVEFQLLNTPLPTTILPDPTPPSTIPHPLSAVPPVIATHFLENAPTPLTRIYNHQLRLQSKLTSLLHHLREAKKAHQKQESIENQIESDRERSRRRAKDNAIFDEELNRMHQQRKQKEEQERAQRLQAQIKPTEPKLFPQNPASPQIKPTTPPSEISNPPSPSEISNPQISNPPAQIKPTTPAPSPILNPPSSPLDPAQIKATAPQAPRAKTPASVYHTPPMLKSLPFIALVTLIAFTPSLRAADSPIDNLTQYLQTDPDKRPPLDKQSFATTPLTHADADAIQKLLWEDHVKQIRESRAQEMKDKKIVEGKLEMPFFYTIFGDKPKTGRSLFISMHGGGGAPKALNDSQWENQKHLYKPAEGVYLAPRAPTNNWNLWHESHIDRMFDRLIEDLIVFEDVDPNRVYIMGYSAGGDGVYQLAPRMADRFAAASMMAGHPNDAQPQGLRNLPFAIHVGALDDAYNRNKVAAEWGKKLDDLQKADPEGYIHVAELHAGRAHWMNLEDAKAVPWMAQYTRNPFPAKVVWKQSTTTHPRFYWLAIPADLQKAGAEIIATFKDQQITIDTKDVDRVIVRLNDHMLDLDKPMTIMFGDRQLYQAVAPRTIAAIAKTLTERGDPASVFDAEVELKLPVILKKEEKKAGADAPANSNPVKPAPKPN